MGYSFTWDPPSDDAVSGCGFNGHQMNYVRMVMLEAGAIAGDGFLAPPRPLPGLEPSPMTLPARRFMYNDGEHITADEAGFIAARLRRAMELRVISELLSFFDDAPDTTEVQKWTEEFATFNERAAQRDGYYVC
jgi:hypothetical protein